MKPIHVVLILCCLLTCATAKNHPIGLNLGSDSLTFCMSGNCSPLPETSLFDDPVNDSIGKACMKNVRLSHLTHIPDLKRRLDALQKGNTIIVRDGRCSLTFPVVVGKRRQQVKRISDQAAIKLRPTVQTMIQRLQRAVPDRPGIIFHLLWSRVLDDVWEKAWDAAFGHSPLPDATWAVYPQHPFTVGTYSYPLPGNGWISLTMGPNSWKYKSKIVEFAADLHRLAWHRQISIQAEAQLQQLGVLDSDMKFRVFTYRTGDHFDQLLRQMIADYATALAGVYDYKGMAKSFRISPAHMFCMLLHETAYAVLDDLRRSGDLNVPAVLTGSENGDVVDVVSIRTADPD